MTRPSNLAGGPSSAGPEALSGASDRDPGIVGLTQEDRRDGGQHHTRDGRAEHDEEAPLIVHHERILRRIGVDQASVGCLSPQLGVPANQWLN